MTTVSFVKPLAPRPDLKLVVFDFDGTLSWLRHGWPEIMLEVCQKRFPTRAGETHTDVRNLLLTEILALNGKPTIYQLRRFVELVAERDGPAYDAEALRMEFQANLDQAIEDRSKLVRERIAAADEFVIHGARALVEHVARRGLIPAILSSTVVERVRDEAHLLDMARYFEPRIFGSYGDQLKFTKRAVFEQLLAETNSDGTQLLSFGDGPVELRETRALGGIAVAVCTDENVNGSGVCDPFKLRDLPLAGADVVMPDFRDGIELIDRLLGK